MNRLIVILALLIIPPLQAQTVRYVSDNLKVPILAGSSTRYKVVRLLASGAPVEILKTDKENGYILVRTQDGVRGWILEDYLMNEPSVRDRLAAAEEAVEPLQTENVTLKEQINVLLAEKNQVAASLTESRADNQRLQRELTQVKETAANTLAIAEENKALSERANDLASQLDQLQQEKQTQADRTRRDWFLIGAGVLLLGILLGVTLPRLRWPKRNRWGDL